MRPNPNDENYPLWQEIAEVVVRNPNLQSTHEILSMCVFPNNHTCSKITLEKYAEEQLQKAKEWIDGYC